MRKVVITGGVGFIGANFVNFLRSLYGETIEITIIDNLTYAANKSFLKDLAGFENVTLFDIPIQELNTESQLLAETDLVFNFAAETHVDNSIADPLTFIQTNVYGTSVLLEECKKNKVRIFIQISTDEVYGSSNGEEWDESQELKPSSPYSSSKAAADLIALSYFHTYGLDIRITRTCNNFGPFQNREKLIPKIISCALSNQSFPLYGSGANFREWIYVEDNCRAIDLVARLGKPGEIYNIGSRFRLSNLGVIDEVAKVMKDSKVQVKHVADRPGHDFGYALSSLKIEHLGFELKYTFEEGLRKTIEWYRKEFEAQENLIT